MPADTDILQKVVQRRRKMAAVVAQHGKRVDNFINDYNVTSVYTIPPLICTINFCVKVLLIAEMIAATAQIPVCYN